MSMSQKLAALARPAVALAAAMSLLAGCETAPREAGEDRTQRRAGTFTAELDLDAFSQLGYRLLWTGAAAMDRRASVRRADVLGDTVLVQGAGNAVSALETGDGTLRWSTTLGGRLTRFVGNARAGDRVLVASDVELFLLSAQTGTLDDRHDLELVVNTPPVVTDGAAFFGSATGRVLAHDLGIGLARWQYQLRGAIEAAPVLVGSNVGVVSESGDVIVIDPASGAARARTSVFGGPGGPPAATGSLIAFTSLDQSAYAFSASGGDRLWRYRTETPLDTALTIIDGVAYFAVPGKGMVGLIASTGEELWSTDAVEGTAIGLVGENVLILDGDRLVAIDERGVKVTETTIPGLHSVIMPEPSGGDLYIVTDRGAVSRMVRR